MAHAGSGLAVLSRRGARGLGACLGRLALVAVVAAGLALAPAARGAIVEGFETGDLSALPWVTYGTVPWTVQSSVVSEGSWAVATVGQPAPGSSTLELDVFSSNASATITFKFRSQIPVDAILDHLSVYVDGVLAAIYVRPTEGFADGSFDVDFGNHTIQFVYMTGPYGGYPEAGVWIDQVVLPENVIPLPQAAFTADPSSGAAPLSVAFTDQSRFSPRFWFWDFGDGSTSTEQSPTHVYTGVGTYTVSLTVGDFTGGDGVTKVGLVTVLGPSVADFTGTPSWPFVAPVTVAFQDTSTGDPTGWLWDFGDGGTSTERNPTHVYMEGGTYTVSLTVTGPLGEDTETKEDVVVLAFADPTPSPGTAAFALFPQALSATRVAMAAEEADSYQGVEYFFEETSGGPGEPDSPWQSSPFFVAEGLAPGTTYLYRVRTRPRVSTSYETAVSAVAAVTTLPREGFESGDLTALAWVAAGTAPWVVQGDTAFGGSWAAASAQGLEDGATSILSLTRDCQAGTVRFQAAVSSQAGADVLRFLVDGVAEGEWSGEVAWTEYAVAVAAGEHTFTWEYAKDAAGSAGDDRAWLDEVELPTAVATAETVYVNTGGGGGCVVGSGAGGAGTLLAVLLPLLLLGAGKRSRRQAQPLP